MSARNLLAWILLGIAPAPTLAQERAPDAALGPAAARGAVRVAPSAVERGAGGGSPTRSDVLPAAGPLRSVRAVGPRTPLGAALSGPAAARTQEVPGPAALRRPARSAHDLARARALFAGSDADGDGRLVLAEARRAGLARRDLRAFDLDRDGAVDTDEFVVGYGGLVAAAGRPVAADLLAEATRVEARRRVLAAQLAQRSRGAGRAPPGVGSPATRSGRSPSDPPEQR